MSSLGFLIWQNSVKYSCMWSEQDFKDDYRTLLSASIKGMPDTATLWFELLCYRRDEGSHSLACERAALRN